MKKLNFLELFLYLLCIICFIIAATSLYGTVSDLATLVFPDTVDKTISSYDPTLYAKRGLITQIPMFIVFSSMFRYCLKIALKERKDVSDEKLKLEDNK